MGKVRKRQVAVAIVCFAMFAVTVFFLLEAMDVFSGEYDKQMLPVIVYYTIQTNIFVALWALYIAVSALVPRLRAVSGIVSMLVTLYISITGVVYWAMLVPMLGFDAKLFSLSNIWMHAVTPTFAIVMFFAFLRGRAIGSAKLSLVVVYPLLYLGFAYILRATSGAYVYPFFDPVAMRGGFGVALALLIIAVLFIGLGAVYRLGWNKRNKQLNEVCEQSANV